MPLQGNKGISHRLFEEVWNRKNDDAVDEIFADDFVLHDPTLPEEVRGPDGYRRFVAMYRDAFPDISFVVEEQVAEGNRVATRYTGSGTHQGDLMGIPPSGNGTRVTGIVIDRISGGKIEESWTNYDALGMMRQIGAVPRPEQAGA